jgi:23S rRNA (uridine2552-2'-O)-methyltransferase
MHADNWAQKAKEKGYRSRAVFKLEEILNKTKIINYSNVLDLGCSPGGWSEYIVKNIHLQKFMQLIS